MTFGQSTDLNFSSNVLPDKIGVNEVTVNGKPVEPGPLADVFTIESRGGKITGGHDGLTYYYTKLPTDKNFTLSADIVIEQFGPETDANPNNQDGAGIMIRDIIGTPRANPQPEGHEEFPAASNMVLNEIRRHNSSDRENITLAATFREGVYQPWGTAGTRMTRNEYQVATPWGKEYTYSLSVSRTNAGFEMTAEGEGFSYSETVRGANANIVEVMDPDYQYVGFVAARNAKITVSNVSLTLSDAETEDAPLFKPEEKALKWDISSSKKTASENYIVQARASYTGSYEVFQDRVSLGSKTVAAGEMLVMPATITSASSLFELVFNPSEGPDRLPQSKHFTVEKVTVDNPLSIVVSADGSSSGDGSQLNPLDLDTAIELVSPGGEIILKPGEYSAIAIPVSVSGTPELPKTLRGEVGVVFKNAAFTHEASYWNIENITVEGARTQVSGSYNHFKDIVTHSAPDTGFQISSGDIGRALWPSHNVVENAISYNNEDEGQIDADGFAAKLGVGDGNVFINCISHSNIDDGWDLFNKTEKGANGVVTIIDSIAYNNGRTFNTSDRPVGSIGNGFKLGGEGIAVPHILKNSVSYNNNMDGITDNFNPGALEVDNVLVVDNARYNLLIRKNPYGDDLKQGDFSNILSMRFAVDSQYDDVVHYENGSSNWFIAGGEPVNPDGGELDSQLTADIAAAVAIDDGTQDGMHQTVMALKAIIDARKQ
ncbi:exopolygalacturonate lyase (plasmid) [Photobacterium sp. DA100]|uniref:right-handed parallel beta-helix repeat-containing protein n=1 Tax=Photobacterium sp. DA100 TaxID=3027472 RepID=UPI00247AEBB4|nr:exopolygalacturonate lyase [Photobacterium sp. DA100]WEM44953.1 exopolygalacturonate lyase [Photobacterium sp. DA100]